LIKLEFPEAAISLDPRRCLAHWRGDERRPPNAAFTAHARQAGALEHTNVLRDRGKRHREARREVADRALARRKPSDDRPARRVRERCKRTIETAGLINHMV